MSAAPRLIDESYYMPTAQSILPSGGVNLRRLTSLIVLLAIGAPAALVAGGCHHARPDSDTNQALVWRIDGVNNTVYLAGSMHVLRAEDYPLPVAFERAYAEAEQLIMELDLDDLEPAMIQAAMTTLGIDPRRRTLDELIGGPAWDVALREAAEIDLDLHAFLPFEPWVVALMVVDMQMQKLGFDSDLGIENHFAQRARADDKKIRGLETVDEQFAFFDALPPEAQSKLLLKSIEDAQQMQQRMDLLVSSWRQGDIPVLVRELTDSFVDFPELYWTLVIQRNANWINTIEQLTNDEDDYLVIVGALHLVGDDSVIELLRERGLEVIRVSD